jgi:hypothetical protein
MPKKKLAVPTLHLNGSSAAGLMNPIRDAASAINDAMERLAACAPHGRDYYVQADPKALEIATAQHVARRDKLQGVYDELVAVWEKIEEQVNEREAR